LRTGLVSVDTNVLLNLYRFQADAREQLFGALEIMGDRLWIPHQVAYEFHRRRLSVIADQESYFNGVKEELESALNGYLARLRAFINRIALPQLDAHRLESMIKQDHAAVLAQVSNSERTNEVHLDNRDSDEVLRRLETLFTNRVGEPMKPEELEAARKEAKRRIEAKIPPGYMDRGKPDPSGDYIIWRQLISEASSRKVPTVFITDDRKEDWYRREHGLTLGSRYELREEMMTQAGAPFLLMTTETFLIQARKYLQVTVSQETVSQAKELPDALASRAFAQGRLDMLALTVMDLETRLDDIDRQLTAHHQLRALAAELYQLSNKRDVLQKVEAEDREIGRLTALREDTVQHIVLNRQEQNEIKGPTGLTGTPRRNPDWDYSLPPYGE
jgi:hypothetical protein